MKGLSYLLAATLPFITTLILSMWLKPGFWDNCLYESLMSAGVVFTYGIIFGIIWPSDIRNLTLAMVIPLALLMGLSTLSMLFVMGPMKCELLGMWLTVVLPIPALILGRLFSRIRNSR